MKKLNALPQESFLKIFFLFLSACFLIAAPILPDRSTMFAGLWQIMSGTCKISTNYFALGGFSATFLNMGLVGLACAGLCCLPGAKPNNVTTLGVLLTIGFASWGINLLNMIPSVLGVFLYCLVTHGFNESGFPLAWKNLALQLDEGESFLPKIKAL